jgi:phospholipid/cholesterol/gamma-HCH transport system substrate-binding protein
MLTRTVKLQLLAFVALTLLGVSYISAEYVGLFKGWFGDDSCTIHADFPDSGGIFTNAEVTYRGVTVGRVGELHLTDQGIRVDLNIEDCKHPRIPANAVAAVSDRSVIGEQYVNLLPKNDNGPYFTGGEVIAERNNTIPVAAQTLLRNLDGLVTSVDLDALRTAVSELGQLFNGRGDTLGQLMDNLNVLVNAARENLPDTLALIRTVGPVLDTQLTEAPALKTFARNLNLLAQQLKTSDPDIRRLVDDSPADLGVVKKFVQDNETDLGVVFVNLADIGDLLVRHLDGLEQIFELYPILAAGSQSTLRDPGIAKLGLVLNVNDPPDCGDPAKGQEGYQGTQRRQPADVTPQAPNAGARCTAPVSSGTNVRGSANVPGGDPYTDPGRIVVPSVGSGADPASETINVGPSLDNAGMLGDNSWLAVLTASLD